jgi:hypothetical protein
MQSSNRESASYPLDDPSLCSPALFDQKFVHPGKAPTSHRVYRLDIDDGKRSHTSPRSLRQGFSDDEERSNLQTHAQHTATNLAYKGVQVFEFLPILHRL